MKLNHVSASLTCLLIACLTANPAAAEPRVSTVDFFPVATQFSPVPSGEGWKGEEGALSQDVLRATVDNIYAHGFRGIQLDTHRPPEEEAFILEYAQSRGMFITAHLGALEQFGRDAPPEPSVFSPEYAAAVRAAVEGSLAGIKNVPRLYNAFPFQDEPFHWGPRSFAYGDPEKAEYLKRYGYDLPTGLDAVRSDPKKWLEFINFQSDIFPHGWRQVYKAIKEIDPSFKVVMTHDSHNTFGAGYSSHSEIAIDDVFHWGGDFADTFVFDIYPYMMFDFRFGECAKLPKPRISQTHYSFAQMRGLTRAYGKELGFWFGTYNPAWFSTYFCPELQAMHWSEREMATTAVAHGADFLLTGYNIPVDAKHWDSLGEGLGLIQKTAGRLVGMPKMKAKACMLFPRTHYLQMQEEYFNVGLSFELFLRAFGELDMLHEEQVKDDTLEGYNVLVLFDIRLLPRAVAERIAAFVQKGGVVIADCVPTLDEDKQPLATMTDLFGVKDPSGERIPRFGHWVPYKSAEPIWANRPENPPDESVFVTDTLQGTAFGQSLDLTLVSPRPCTATESEVLAATAAGKPGVLHRGVGKGHAFLLGFCLQDTYFKTYQDGNEAARNQLRGLLHAMTETAGVKPHIYSSNADIEATVRASGTEAFVFVINHEAPAADTAIQLANLGFEIAAITNVADDQPVAFERREAACELTLNVPLGETRILHVKP
ncbi:MAG: hypothetical protein WC655_04340 [Candidatus Hydrogenedentales bacterium]|jgi:hypothetical protein